MNVTNDIWLKMISSASCYKSRIADLIRFIHLSVIGLAINFSVTFHPFDANYLFIRHNDALSNAQCANIIQICTLIANTIMPCYTIARSHLILFLILDDSIIIISI